MLSISTQIGKDDNLASFSRMLESVSFASEIIIFALDREDSEFREIAYKHSAKIINRRTPPIIEHLREDQVKAASNSWVLILDYDELIPDKLQKEILKVIKEQSTFGAYKIGRLNFSLSYPLRHGGWERDLVTRLINTARFKSWGHEIHGEPVVDGEFGVLKNVMEHHKDASLEQMVAKTNRYSEIEASQFVRGGIVVNSSFSLFRKFHMELIRRYLLKCGFLDREIGLIQSIYQAYSVFISYAKTYEKQIHKQS